MRKIIVFRKAQAVTEYLHTYGWIIMSVMMIAGFLVYFDVSSVESVLPMECSFLSGLGCLDAGVDETVLSISVVNEFGFDMSNISMSIVGTCNSTANTTDGNLYGNANVLLANQQAIYLFDCENLTRMNVDEKIIVGYVNVWTGKSHQKVGSLQYSPTKS